MTDAERLIQEMEAAATRDEADAIMFAKLPDITRGMMPGDREALLERLIDIFRNKPSVGGDRAPPSV